MKNYEYEAALSYAYNDREIAGLIANELKYIFEDRFFQDCMRQEELAMADSLKGKLRKIYSNSRYAVILYSKEYIKGNNAMVEFDEIIKKAHHDRKNNYFIINLNNTEIVDEKIKDAIYIPLITEKGNPYEIAEKVNGIIKTIKDTIKKETFANIIDQAYRIKIQTLFMPGIVTTWDQKYDWNIFTQKFIGNGGREIESKYKWTDLWNYLEAEFLSIKEQLEREESLRKIRRVIYLNCHLSIAYKLGNLYGDLTDSSGNRNLLLINSRRIGDMVFDFKENANIRDVDDFCIEYDGNDEKSNNIIYIISVKPTSNENIIFTVESALKK